MGDKKVTELAGVGDVLGQRLEDAGFDKVRNRQHTLFHGFCNNTHSIQAYTVLGQYLVLKKDADLFKEWMKETCHANSKQAADCYQCLNDWCEEFL